ncbi:MAG: conserved rane protein of unknown function [Nitrospira sp.]|jgi:hypothetical protein|nr:conserved rane protein of unknown function [Nitrospira sp.]
MNYSPMPLYIKSVLRDALTVYGLTFAGAIGSAIAGLNMQTNPSTAYLTNLFSGAIGFAMAGIRVSAHRAEYMAWVAVVFWIFNLTNMVLGIQTYAAWVHSGVTIIIMAVLGSAFATVLSPFSNTMRSLCPPAKTE